jgi:transposase
MTPEEIIARQERQLADERESNARLQRMLERQGFQLDRMQDQLERALGEIAALRRLLNKPPPDEPPPKGAAPASTGPDTPAPAPPVTPDRPKAAPKKKGKFGRNAIPAGLTRIPDAVPAGVCCVCQGATLKPLRDEVVEIYDYVPAKIVVRAVTRPVCRCMACQHIQTASYPDDLIPRMRATPALIGHIIFEKYGRHLPLHRVDKELARLGAEIPEATRDRWLRWAAKQLDTLFMALKRIAFAVGLIHTDGTGLDVIEPKLGTRLGQMAVFGNHVATLFDFTPTKHGIHQRRFLGLEDKDGKAPGPEVPRFAGYVVADASSIADRTFLDRSLIECGCNAHARRKFEDAEVNFRKLAGEALAFWTALYAIEAEATRAQLDADARLVLRRTRSAPVVADFRRWLDTHLGTFLPKDEITTALNYTNNHWDALTRFLTDGRIPIDNNWAERAVKAIALGRNAYMFAGSDAAGRRSATFYSFVATCLQHEVDPYDWLAWVLPRIATTRNSELGDLLPINWKRDREQRAAA